MSRADRDRWDSRHATNESRDMPPEGTLQWLGRTDARHGSLALDLACGKGRHTRALLDAGYRVVAADISRVALSALRATTAREQPLMLIQLDVEAWPFVEASFDLIVQIDFLDRAALALIKRAVKPGGLLLIDTFAGPPSPGRPGPQRSAWRLDHGELAERFADWEVLHIHDAAGGDRAAILARRPGRRHALR